MSQTEQIADRAADVVLLSAAGAALLGNVEHVAVTFSAMSAGLYYATKAAMLWIDRCKRDETQD